MATQGRRRAYGQHYLHDRGIIDSIAESWQKEFEREPVDELLEIGPGEGALTEALLKWVEEDSARPALTIGERDPRLIEKWQPRIEALDRVRIVPGDYADIDGRVFLPPDLQAQLGVISNLPYSAGTRIFLNLVDHRAQIPWMVLMFQQEVAMRLRAGSGEKGRGSLSVWTQTYYDVQKERLVPPGAFKPPPEVMSEVVIVRRKSTPEVSFTGPEKEVLWSGLLQTAFSQPRKMIRSNLGKNATFAPVLERSGVEGTLRAAQLDWEHWRALAGAL